MHWIWLVLFSVFLSGCGNTGTVPVRDGSNGVAPNYYRVKAGDTLYSISWRYHLDYKSVAAANNIKAPYTIYAGQNILLRGKKSSEVDDGIKHQASAKKKSARTDIASSRLVVPNEKLRWQWPIEGEVIKEFSLSGTINKGIDIKGSSGQRVNAAADGTVVYAGGNLRGYGKLVILKHNNRFLSAYGNNQEIRVREGEKVRGGQVIGTLGATTSLAEMLHFEIRLDGRPQNPFNYLP